VIVAIKYKDDILARLKEQGYTTSRLRKEKVFGEKTMQDFRRGTVIPYKTIDKLCALLGCGVGDVIEYLED
jgi:putative transcriptional regulator